MRLFSFTMLCLSTVFCVASLCGQDAPPQKKGGGGPPKNLKVLPPDTNIRVVMGGYRAALGVTCDFCHVQDRASDENPKKNIARMMITMVHDINTKSFTDGKEHVTCYTCHRGTAAPLTAPPPAAPGL
jgi:hypothetical protein